MRPTDTPAPATAAAAWPTAGFDARARRRELAPTAVGEPADGPVLARIEAEQLLAVLTGERRLVLELLAGLHVPDDWDGEAGERWPPTCAAVGRYVGVVVRGKRPLKENTIRYIRDRARATIRAHFGIPEPTTPVDDDE